MTFAEWFEKEHAAGRLYAADEDLATAGWNAAILAAALTTKTAGSAPERPFALIRDRNYDGEGLSLWVWNGENYSGTDGDCLSRDSDGSLDGFEVEWLNDYELECRLNSAPKSA
jgi:hypothetical protein